jgi:hypothetical protein
MRPRQIVFLLLLLALLGIGFAPPPQLNAASNPPPGPDRYTVIHVDYTAYTWWVANWSKNEVVCDVVADHEGTPTPAEIYRDCGQTVYDKWVSQPPCIKQNNSKNCVGYYVFPVFQQQAVKEIPTKLPEATAWLTLENCESVSSVSTSICETLPNLVVTGQEPLPNENIIRIEGAINNVEFACDEVTCSIPLEGTDEDGVQVTFWAYSSYGDSSPVYTAQVRVAQADEGDPDQLYWYVDVISSQWQGQPVATCSDSWQVFPPVGGAPEWLNTPKESEELSSDIPYTYLAANLILQGAVDASACPDGGLIPAGGVNTCGVETARPAVTEWQNQFDKLILDTANSTSVPARLLKNLFARESQFWPGVFRSNGDAGLGQLTEDGADTTLFWNSSFFTQFCPLVLSSDACGEGYAHLDSDEQALLRGALVGSVNATCEDCPLGIDLSQADFSVTVFAHTLLANCEQAGRIVRNYTSQAPGLSVNYEDMWKFTLVNYNAGPGCLGDAIEGARGQGKTLVWENVSAFLPGVCTEAIDYVNDISK